jgi:hypothetical protein
MHVPGTVRVLALCLVSGWWCGFARAFIGIVTVQQQQQHGQYCQVTPKGTPPENDPLLLRRRNGRVTKTALGSSTQPSTTTNNNIADPTTTALVRNLLQLGRQYGPVGDRQPKEVQERVLAAARALSKRAATTTVPPDRYAHRPLTGTHDLVYSSAPGGSSGKLGPFDGRVRQTFVDDTTFVNSVELGPLTISLTATREIRNDDTMAVFFQSTTVQLWDRFTVLSRSITGGGIWQVLYVGTIVDDFDGRTKLVRVMETPSLFVLEQLL